jgi:uncharacterized repeat protein (TIGR03843 family)
MSTESMGFAEAEELLLAADFQDCRPLWYSSNYVYLAHLCGPGGEPFAVVYKPRRGESPLWDFPEGTLYRREVAAYRLSRLLDWPFVPPTVARDGPEGVGSVQLFIAHDQTSHYFEQREVADLVPQLKRMAAFDFVANNADRKGGHCLLDPRGRVWGIDHGLCFHEQYKMRTVMWDWADEPLPENLLGEVRIAGAALANGSPGVAALKELLAEREVEAIALRMERIVAEGVFPKPGPHRSYPWPLV